MRYVWDPFVRIFHWSLVIAFAIAFATHASEWDRVTHVNAGYTAGFLIVARIIWGLMKTGYARFQAFPFQPTRAALYVWQIFRGHAQPFIGHNPAGSLIIYLLLLCGLLTISSGYLVYNDGWLIDDPELLQNMHFFSAWTWLGLVCLHVTGVITESILHKDNLILAMFTGVKRQSTDTALPKNYKIVSRETLHAFARWTLAVRSICKSYIRFDRVNKRIYSQIEEIEPTDKFGLGLGDKEQGTEKDKKNDNN